MFEYIKRVSIAVSFIAQKIDTNNKRIKDTLELVSFDILFIAQNFRNDEYKVEDLKKLQNKISYLIDLMDFARINNYVSSMNAKVFTETQVNFLRHIINLIDQKNALSLPVYQLQEMEEFFARKNAKESIQSKISGTNTLDFSELPTEQKITLQDIPKYAPHNSKPEPVNEADKPKKILEESMITPQEDTQPKAPVNGSLEDIEKEIEARRNRILKALINGGGSIKEISSKITDVNEKTIQRDLLELMRDKKVIMLGKKRWAKYYLK